MQLWRFNCQRMTRSNRQANTMKESVKFLTLAMVFLSAVKISKQCGPPGPDAPPPPTLEELVQLAPIVVRGTWWEKSEMLTSGTQLACTLPTFTRALSIQITFVPITLGLHLHAWSTQRMEWSICSSWTKHQQGTELVMTGVLALPNRSTIKF